ncbi:MAG: OsmC family protein [Bacteroidetes bacterium]|nr:OsmC family protein [Bacteroidota bacterium]
MLGDEVYEATNENGNTVKIDMRKKEEKKALSPMELVLSAVAGCGAVDIVSMLKKRKKTVTKFVIDAEAGRMETPPRYFTSIHCKYIITSPDVTEEELTKVAALTLEKYCSVVSSLKAEVTFDVEVIRS